MPLNSDGECRENIPLARRKTAATHSHKSCYTVFVFQMHRYELRTTLLFLFVIASWDLASSRCLFFCSGVSELLPVRYHTNCKICGMQPDRTDHSWLNLSPSNPPPPKKETLSLFCILQYSLLPMNGVFPLNYLKTVFDFCLLWRTDSADRGVWMNIRCISTTQTGKTMCGPPEDAGKGIVWIKGKRGTQQNEGSQGLWPH